MLPDGALDRQASALRVRLGHATSVLEREASAAELATVEAEIGHRATPLSSPQKEQLELQHTILGAIHEAEKKIVGNLGLGSGSGPREHRRSLTEQGAAKVPSPFGRHDP